MINKAIAFAAKAHEGQLRKGTNLPYILHPIEVGVIVSRMTNDEEVIAAAVLHDTVEDCKFVSIDQIRQEFGDRVARIVAAESDDKSKGWKERKSLKLEALKKETVREVKLVALGDKLSNIRSLKNDYDRIGEEVWLRFNMKQKQMQGWYYRGLCDALSDLEDLTEYQEFCELVDNVFGEEADFAIAR